MNRKITGKEFPLMKNLVRILITIFRRTNVRMRGQKNKQKHYLKTKLFEDKTMASVRLEFEKQLWEMADKLRGNIVSSEYKHVVLALSY